MVAAGNLQPQFGEHFMAHDSGIGDSNKMIKNEIKDGGLEGTSQAISGENGKGTARCQIGPDGDDKAIFYVTEGVSSNLVRHIGKSSGEFIIIMISLFFSLEGKVAQK